MVCYVLEPVSPGFHLPSVFEERRSAGIAQFIHTRFEFCILCYWTTEN